MPIPITPAKHVNKTSTDIEIDAFLKLEKPTKSGLNKIKLKAQIEERIELMRYRKDVSGMSNHDLIDEAHESARLAQFMSIVDPRPHPLCDAHAIVSGGHKRAATLRGILAWFEMRIDDRHNGCWLPKNTAAKEHMPKYMKRAVPHSRIHRVGYYNWLDTLITLDTISTVVDLKRVLGLVRSRLIYSTFPKNVMLPAHMQERS